MSQSWQGKPDRFRPTNPLNMDKVWKTATADDAELKPPKPNSLGEVPYNLMIHDLDNLYDVSSAIVVDRGVGNMLIKKLKPLSEIKTRQEIQLLIATSSSDVIAIHVWAIPIFVEGVMVYLLYAADYENRQLLKMHRNPAKPAQYDITSL